MICDWWISIRFVCFCVSRFIACDRNYDWRQRKTQLWRRLLNFRVRVFLKRAVKYLPGVLGEFSRQAWRVTSLQKSLRTTGNKAEKQDCSTYSAVIKLVNRHHEPPVLLYFSDFPGWLSWFSLQISCLNNKIHFSLANANNSFKRKRFENDGFCSFTNNKQTCEWSCQRFRPG